jgi:hypothetical protein
MCEKRSILDYLYKTQEIFKEITYKVEKWVEEEDKKEIDCRFNHDNYRFFFRNSSSYDNNSFKRSYFSTDSNNYGGFKKILSEKKTIESGVEENKLDSFDPCINGVESIKSVRKSKTSNFFDLSNIENSLAYEGDFDISTNFLTIGDCNSNESFKLNSSELQKSHEKTEILESETEISESVCKKRKIEANVEPFLTKIDDIYVFEKDIDRLNGTTELNDTVIVAFMKAFFLYNVIVLPSVVISQIIEGKKILNIPKNLAKYDYICGPVYLKEKKHWCLFFASVRKYELIFIDSLGHEKDMLYKIRINWNNFARNYLLANEEYQLSKHCFLHSKQNDNFSCGVFVCYFFEKLITGQRDLIEKNLDGEDLKRYREFIRNMILSKRLNQISIESNDDDQILKMSNGNFIKKTKNIRNKKNEKMREQNKNIIKSQLETEFVKFKPDTTTMLILIKFYTIHFKANPYDEKTFTVNSIKEKFNSDKLIAKSLNPFDSINSLLKENFEFINKFVEKKANSIRKDTVSTSLKSIKELKEIILKLQKDYKINLYKKSDLKKLEDLLSF